EIALDVSHNTLSVLITLAFSGSFPVTQKAAALHGGRFLTNTAAAELRIPTDRHAHQTVSGVVTGTLDYLRDCFSPVYTNLLFPE
ncbi:MAG: hypothetical protein LBQ48_03560, partial [Oscillospiraceae bacterium]|nr:hypothetical protein [Oscillospiraceae bacterium]